MTPLDYKAQAAAALLERRKARGDLAVWSRTCGFEPARHHLFMIDRLQKVVSGEIKRLMLFLPPGSAKSTYGSVLFPPWFLAQQPNTAILTCSRSADLAEAFGRRSRNLITEHEKTLGYGLKADSQSASRWETSNGGEFFCAGVGGKIAGRRADLALIDDPVGSKEDAYSKLMRDKAWDWFNFDFRSRWKPNARCILIQTRWHEDDLAGRLLREEGDEWEVVRIPLIAEKGDQLGREEGECLWPDYFTAADVRDRKKDHAVFSALNQQRPVAEDGDFFKADWIHGYNEGDLPKDLNLYGASDHAISQAQDADSTVLGLGGVDSSGVLWIHPDLIWDKLDSEEQVRGMTSLMKRLNPKVWRAEKGHISKSLGPFLASHMRDEKVFTYVEEVTPSRDKQTRAQSIRGRMKLGMVRFPTFAPWFKDARAQMLAFPVGTHDDFVDFLAHLGMLVDSMQKASTPTPKAPPPTRFTYGWLKQCDRREKRQRHMPYAFN